MTPLSQPNTLMARLLCFSTLWSERWAGGIDPLKVQTIFGGVPSWSLWVMWGRWICQSRSERPSKTVVIPVFHVDYCLPKHYSCWEWDVRAASQWLISSDVQPESLHSVDHPPRPCVHFPSSSRRLGMALFISFDSLISLAWRRTSCLWRSTGSVYSSLPSGLSFRSWTLSTSRNLMLLRAKISSSSLSWIRGSISCIKALT